MNTFFSNNAWLQRHRNLLTALALMVAAWVLYSPSLKYDFIYYDDVRILRDHPELYGNATLAADLKAIFVTCFPREEPLLLRDVVWAVDSRLFGFGNALGYHLTNVLLHGVVVALLFFFLLRTTRRYDFALITAAVFLLLAVHVEPVAWIMGSKDILSTMFMLLALIVQTKRLNAKSLPIQCGWYFATIIFLLAGLGSKISVLTFPAVLFLHAVLLPYLQGELLPGAPLAWRRAVREGLFVVPALAISGFVYVWYQRTIGQTGLLDRGYTDHGWAHLWNLLMINPMVFWGYVQQLFLPLHLSVLYAWPTLEPAYPTWQVIASLATVAGILGTCGWLLWRRKDLFFYFASGLALMVPYLNLMYIGIWQADRYVYFSSFCVVAIAVTLGSEVWRRSQSGFRTVLPIIGGLLLANNLFQSVSDQPNWRDGESLWQYHIALPQPDSKAFDNLGAYYFADFDKATAARDLPRMTAAMKKLRVVIDGGLEKFWPDRSQSPPAKTYFLFFLRSLVEEVNGDSRAALASLLISDQLRPGFDSTNLNLARIYRELGKAEKERHQKQTYLKGAHDRFTEYTRLVYRGRTPPPEVQQEMKGIDTEYAAAVEDDSKERAIP